MTIFKNIQELRDCVLDMEEHFPEDYHYLIGEIDKIKTLDLNDESKQNICNGEIRKVLIKNNIVPSFKIVDWLTEKREEYLERTAYFQRENEWKKKSNTDTE